MEEKISIVVPVYNKEKYLYQCLESLRMQTYQNIEILLVDDESTDDSPSVCQRFCQMDMRFRYIRQKNGGQNAARKTGAEMTQGAWVMFVDADDYVSPEMCAVLMQHQEETGADMVYGCIQKVPGKKGENAYHGWDGVLSGKEILRNVLPIGSSVRKRKSGVSGLGCGLIPILMRLEFALDAFRHVDMRIRYSEDLGCLFYILLRVESVAFVPEIVYYYRQTPGSALHAQGRSCLLSTKWLQAFLEKQFREQGMLLEDECLIEQALIRTLLCGGYEFFDDYPGIYPFFQGPRGRRLAVYGAGVVGKELVYKLSGFELAGWFDRDFERYRALRMNVQSPAEIAHCDFDVMVIAIQHPEIAEVVRNSLVEELPLGVQIYTFSEEILCSGYTKRKMKELHDVDENYIYQPRSENEK